MDVEETKRLLLAQEDTNNDCQITVEDKGPKTFRIGLQNTDGLWKQTIKGTYPISLLLQELALASSAKQRLLVIEETVLFENPVDRINRMITKYFWSALRRTIDASGLELICSDPKYVQLQNGLPQFRIYVPVDDSDAFLYFSSLAFQRESFQHFEVIPLPPSAEITPAFIKGILDRPGILSLKLLRSPLNECVTGVPFIVPGGRFNELYGWDSYFIILGLLADGMVDQAKGILDNLLYEVEYYGKVLNANRSYYLGRSQPPFLTAMIRQVYSQLPRTADSVQWFVRAFHLAIREYRQVWMSAPRFVPISAMTQNQAADQYVQHGPNTPHTIQTGLSQSTSKEPSISHMPRQSGGLSRYCGELEGVIPPETEPTHFDSVIEPLAKQRQMSIAQYREEYSKGAAIEEPILDEYFFHDQAVRESGHDTTYRLDGVAGHLLTVDLNCLLYRYECDVCDVLEEFSSVIQDYFPDEHVEEWQDKRNQRKYLINRYLWNEEDGLFYDFNFVTGKQSTYKSATAFYAMWSGLCTAEQALRLMNNLKLFEESGGIVSGTKDSLLGLVSIDKPNRQWDYPYGWAPHQMLIWEALSNYGYLNDAARLAYRWLFMITKIFCNFNGVIVEKYDVVNATHKVNVEYGNVGTEFKYVPNEGFGWVNASYRVGMVKYLREREHRALGILLSPQILFPLH